MGTPLLNLDRHPTTTQAGDTIGTFGSLTGIRGQSKLATESELSEQMEQPEDPPFYPVTATFAELLAWHLFIWGTRPTEVPGEPNSRKKWLQKEFALALVDDDLARYESSYSKLGQWLRGDKKPAGKASQSQIKSLLFNSSPQHQAWARDLLEAPKSPRALAQKEIEHPITPTAQIVPTTQGIVHEANESPNSASEFMELFRRKELFKRAPEYGIPEDTFSEEALDVSKKSMDNKEKEIEILIDLLRSNFDYQQQFAFGALCDFDQLSNRAIDFMFQYIAKHERPWAMRLQNEFFTGALNERKKEITAFTLIQSHDPIARHGGLIYICKRGSLSKEDSANYICDRDESVQELIFDYCNKRMYFDESMIPQLIKLITGSNSCSFVGDQPTPSIHRMVALATVLSRRRSWSASPLPNGLMPSSSAFLRTSSSTWIGSGRTCRAGMIQFPASSKVTCWPDAPAPSRQGRSYRL